MFALSDSYHWVAFKEVNSHHIHFLSVSLYSWCIFSKSLCLFLLQWDSSSVWLTHSCVSSLGMVLNRNHSLLQQTIPFSSSSQLQPTVSFCCFHLTFINADLSHTSFCFGRDHTCVNLPADSVAALTGRLMADNSSLYQTRYPTTLLKSFEHIWQPSLGHTVTITMSWFEASHLGLLYA